MKSYKVFNSAAGDINNANGTFYYNDYDCDNATGDILNASGVGTCDPATPYPFADIQNLRNIESVAQREWSEAWADEQVKLKIWQECKSRLWCNASSDEKKLDAAEALTKSRKVMLDSAKTEVAKAEKANAEADKQYDECYEREQVQLAEEAEQAQAMAELGVQSATELAEIETEQQKVSVAQMEAGKDYAIYAAIAVGVIAVSFFGYKIMK